MPNRIVVSDQGPHQPPHKVCARVQSSLVFCRIFLWPDQQPATFVLVDGGVVDVAEISLLDTATRFAFACVLKHCGLLADALERTG